jgi:hypothetical protein
MRMNSSRRSKRCIGRPVCRLFRWKESRHEPNDGFRGQAEHPHRR